MDPVKAAPTPAALARDLRAAALDRGFREEGFGQIEGVPLFALTRRTPGIRPRIYLSAGIHGDEPAPPLALLQLIGSGVLDDRALWFVCPLLNPGGLASGTRENPAGIDLNRDYRSARSPEIRAHLSWLQHQPLFDLTFCLHEDWEAKGFYLYEQNPDAQPSLAAAILKAASAHLPIDRSPVIDGRPCEGGVIHPPTDPFSRELWPEAIYLRAHHTSLAYTLETPTAVPLGTRVATLAAAVAAAVDVFLAARRQPGP